MSCRTPECRCYWHSWSLNDMCASVCFEYVAAVNIAAVTNALSCGNNTAEVICPGMAWQQRVHSSGLQENGGGMPSTAPDGCVVTVALVDPSPSTY